MIKHIITLTILVHLAYGQELEDYETEVVSEWSSGQYLNNLVLSNAYVYIVRVSRIL